ncbi:uncharacterized protein MONBRDRAFT_18507 [Monosiga brevicollis MX1]|uniref:DUS-like FMN-binding domain-containing protein n=1 Tax=Monosiga brevicollis TaxID=81824 RepID=A9UW45_MONBE|nr:uncharacterized protein MONBRDRAFT_18507 [Monosiga brevicollis MX1]EDQ90704.1 predicted protein [Monosiga brevicollis MX1]|eukprot:XP_001744755.1 hypothetical protein [Monosiga brevicollis MX1]
MAAAGGVIEGGVVAGPVHEMQEWLRSLGAKRVFLAPLVGGSDLAFRTMCYERGVVAAFSPMLYARHAVENPNYLNLNLDTQPAENVIVQFCANNGDFFARAIDKVRLRCRGVDLNLSWTSKRAERGGYGEYLLKNPTQLESVVRAGVATQVPITCKLRLQASVAETIATAQRLEAWGVSLLTIEGRTSAQLDSRRGIANWEDIAQIRAAVGIPILYNGDLVVREQIEACLAYTGWFVRHPRNPPTFDHTKAHTATRSLPLTRANLHV